MHSPHLVNVPFDLTAGLCKVSLGTIPPKTITDFTGGFSNKKFELINCVIIFWSFLLTDMVLASVKTQTRNGVIYLRLQLSFLENRHRRNISLFTTQTANASTTTLTHSLPTSVVFLTVHDKLLFARGNQRVVFVFSMVKCFNVVRISNKRGQTAGVTMTTLKVAK